MILAPSESTKTLVLGAQAFLGEFINDYNAVLAALTLAILTPVVLYLIFSRQLIRGITAGAVKLMEEEDISVRVGSVGARR